MTTPAASQFGGTVVPTKYQSQILTSAIRWGIPPAVLAAQIDTESSFNPNSVSSAGAVGIAQFLPSTAKEMKINPYNPNAAIDGMAHLDSIYLKQYGSMSLALAAYNAGPGAVDKANGVPPFAETQNYVKTILAKAGNAVTSVTEPISNPLTDLGHVTSLLTNLSNPTFLKRIGVGALGATIVGAGVFFMVAKEPGTARALRKVVNMP